MPVPSDPQFPNENYQAIVKACINTLWRTLTIECLNYLETEPDEPTRPLKGLFVGRCMKALEGRANPVLVNATLDWLLTERGLFHAYLLFLLNKQAEPSLMLLDSLSFFVEKSGVANLQKLYGVQNG